MKKRHSLKTTAKWFAITFLCLLFIAIILFSIYTVFPLQKAQIKRLNNPYINSDYSKWKENVFFEQYRFSMPSEWIVETQDEDTYLIMNNASIIAVVGKLGSNSRYLGSNDFCSAVIQSKNVETPYEDAVKGEHFGNGCDAYRITVMNSQHFYEQHYYLLTEYPTNRCAVLFCSDSLSSNEQLDYAVAMGYSYENAQQID